MHPHARAYNRMTKNCAPWQTFIYLQVNTTGTPVAAELQHLSPEAETGDSLKRWARGGLWSNANPAMESSTTLIHVISGGVSRRVLLAPSVSAIERHAKEVKEAAVVMEEDCLI